MEYGDTENILVENCEFKTTSAAIKFGSETCGDIHDIRVRNIKISDTNRGISFQLRDMGNIYNISFENIDMETKRFHPLEWWGKGEPIFISQVRRKEEIKTGYIKNVLFKDINITSENGIFIYGENNISNIKFEDINMELKGMTSFERGNHDLRPYYKDMYLVEGLADGIYIFGANNIEIKDYNLSVNKNFKNDFGKRINTIDVYQLSIDK